MSTLIHFELVEVCVLACLYDTRYVIKEALRTDKDREYTLQRNLFTLKNVLIKKGETAAPLAVSYKRRYCFKQ